MARIREPSGLEVVKLFLSRTYLQPGEQIVGTLDFRASILAADAAFKMNVPGIFTQSHNFDREHSSTTGSQMEIDPYICTQYCISLMAEEIIHETETEISDAYNRQSSLNFPVFSSKKITKSMSMGQINIQSISSKDSRKNSFKTSKKEARITKSAFSDVVFGADIVGFKFQVPKESLVPTFQSSIGNSSCTVYFLVYSKSKIISIMLTKFTLMIV